MPLDKTNWNLFYILKKYYKYKNCLVLYLLVESRINHWGQVDNFKIIGLDK